eukprot:4003451-Prymnesium_polylepis.2
MRQQPQEAGIPSDDSDGGAGGDTVRRAHLGTLQLCRSPGSKSLGSRSHLHLCVVPGPSNGSHNVYT